LSFELHFGTLPVFDILSYSVRLRVSNQLHQEENLFYMVLLLLIYYFIYLL